MASSFDKAVIKGQGIDMSTGGFTELVVNGKTYSSEHIAKAALFYEKSLLDSTTLSMGPQSLEQLSHISEKLATSLQKLIRYVHHTTSSTEAAISQIHECLDRLQNTSRGPEFEEFMEEINGLQSYAVKEEPQACVQEDNGIDAAHVNTHEAVEEAEEISLSGREEPFPSFKEFQDLVKAEASELEDILAQESTEEIFDLPTLEAMLQSELGIEIDDKGTDEEEASVAAEVSTESSEASAATTNDDAATDEGVIKYDFLTGDEQTILRMMKPEQQKMWHDYVASERVHFYERYGIKPDDLTSWSPRKNFVDWTIEVI